MNTGADLHDIRTVQDTLHFKDQNVHASSTSSDSLIQNPGYKSPIHKSVFTRLLPVKLGLQIVGNELRLIGLMAGLLSFLAALYGLGLIIISRLFQELLTGFCGFQTGLGTLKPAILIKGFIQGVLCFFQLFAQTLDLLFCLGKILGCLSITDNKGWGLDHQIPKVILPFIGYPGRLGFLDNPVTKSFTVLPYMTIDNTLRDPLLLCKILDLQLHFSPFFLL